MGEKVVEKRPVNHQEKTNREHNLIPTTMNGKWIWTRLLQVDRVMRVLSIRWLGKRAGFLNPFGDFRLFSGFSGRSAMDGATGVGLRDCGVVQGPNAEPRCEEVLIHLQVDIELRCCGNPLGRCGATSNVLHPNVPNFTPVRCHQTSGPASGTLMTDGFMC